MNLRPEAVQAVAHASLEAAQNGHMVTLNYSATAQTMAASPRMVPRYFVTLACQECGAWLVIAKGDGRPFAGHNEAGYSKRTDVFSKRCLGKAVTPKRKPARK
jgi:hypothetical protein